MKFETLDAHARKTAAQIKAMEKMPMMRKAMEAEAIIRNQQATIEEIINFLKREF